MEEAGVMVAFGGIFLGIYFIVKAIVQVRSMRRANPTRNATGGQDVNPAAAFDDEPGA